MRLQFTVGAVMLALATATAWAQGPAAPVRDPSSQPVEETVYATDQHMGFSIRNSLIQWLGGVGITHPPEVEASKKDGWWGEQMPWVSLDVLQSQQQAQR